MSTQKHTQGPWLYESYKNNDEATGYRVTNGMTVVAYVNFQEENAALIAAAPDLLEALKALSRLVSQSDLAFSPENVAAQLLISEVGGA